jgi:hypothetical protein
MSAYTARPLLLDQDQLQAVEQPIALHRWQRNPIFLVFTDWLIPSPRHSERLRCWPAD